MIKKLLVTILAASLVVSGCSSEGAAVNEGLEEDIELEDDQILIIGQVTEINGNEVTIALAEERSGGMSFGGEMPEGEMPEGEMPEGEMPEGEMPERGMSRGEMPEGEMPSGERPDFSQENAGDFSDGNNQSLKSYVLTGEERTIMIPVGTEVTTLLGTVSTFSRIAIDNTLKIVIETDEAGDETVVKVWIVG